METAISQLWDIYNTKEDWHKKRLTEEEFYHYTFRLINTNNLFYELVNNKVTGYVEVWRINYEQFGRISCGEKFYVYDENITDGCIAYISNMWSENIITTNNLTLEFINRFGHLKYMTTERRKGTSVRVYPMKRISKISKIGA
jgi:hypothetical protein